MIWKAPLVNRILLQSDLFSASRRPFIRAVGILNLNRNKDCYYFTTKLALACFFQCYLNEIPDSIHVFFVVFLFFCSFFPSVSLNNNLPLACFIHRHRNEDSLVFFACSS